MAHSRLSGATQGPMTGTVAVVADVAVVAGSTTSVAAVVAEAVVAGTTTSRIVAVVGIAVVSATVVASVPRAQQLVPGASVNGRGSSRGPCRRRSPGTGRFPCCSPGSFSKG